MFSEMTKFFHVLHILPIVVVVVVGDLEVPQFSNRVYSAYAYTGSRLLETNYSSNAYVDAEWTQTSTVDTDGNIFLTHTERHSIISIPANTQYHPFPSTGSVYAGTAGLPGYNDGTLQAALFRSPKGIAVYEPQEYVKYLFVADTGNHCVRRIDTSPWRSRVITIAGVPGTSGLRDGDGRKALFSSPTSVGVDPASGLLFVLDNGGVIRMINITEADESMSVQVSTLVEGACRAIGNATVYETIVKRTVRCQTGWITSSEGSTTETDQWTWPTVCLGNSITCSTRYDEL